jgi:hypothetical protein
VPLGSVLWIVTASWFAPFWTWAVSDERILLLILVGNFMLFNRTCRVEPTDAAKKGDRTFSGFGRRGSKQVTAAE